MLKEIGSNFWLSKGDKKNTNIDNTIFNVDYEDEVFTSSGRSAISLVLSDFEIQCKRALLPSFTCESVIVPFLQKGYHVEYYSVGNNLIIDRDSFLKDIKNSDASVILIHNYFGFDTTSSIKEVITDLRKQGIVVIEDITQVLYSSFERLHADYYVGSFRKWDGIPDGGFVLKANGRFRFKPEKEDTRLIEAKIDAMMAKYNYLFCGVGEKSVFLKKFSEAEELLEKQSTIYRMAEASYKEQANLNIDLLKAKRRSNYQYLLRNLNHKMVTPLFEHIADSVVPLYFPVLCGGARASLQVWLRDNHIFAPIVWPKPECILDAIRDTDYFYDNLLCIPCDQRYGQEEMEKVISVIDKWDR